MHQPESAERWAWLAEHGDALRRTLRRRLGADEAEDVASEAILRAGMKRLGMTIERNPSDEPHWFQTIGVLVNRAT